MTMKKEKSPTEAAVARPVVFPEQDHALSAAVAFTGLSEENKSMNVQESGHKPGLAAFQTPAEAKDGSLVASGSKKPATELCAWCSKVITHGDVLKPFTHGICWQCSAIYFPMELAGIRANCDHDFDETVTDHDTDSEPVSMNPFSGSITSRVYCFEIVTQECKKCGLVNEGETRDCQEHS